MKRCTACNEPFRKGRRRVVLHFDGSLATALVCPGCVARSVSIVTPFPRGGLTVTGVDLLQRVSDRLRTYLTAATLIEGDPDRSADTRMFQRGRADALAAAVELVQRAISGIEP